MDAIWLSRCVCLLAYIICSVNSQDQPATNVCSDQRTCGECIVAAPNCGWCRQGGYDSDNKDRCDLVSNLIQNGCNESLIDQPDHEVTYVMNEAPRNAIEETGKEAIQLAPQKMRVKIRPNKPFTFNMTYRQAEDFPVDLYFVMDLSKSMEDDKNNLADLGLALAERMKEITKNFRLGFGSFVDKKTMPYVSTVPEKLISPCTDCAAPYGFRNQLRLTDETDIFADEVKAAPISGNLDSPEGGFDAVMQAIACKKEIGWRPLARKLLLFSSDARSHYAGDGLTEIGWRNSSRKMLLFSTDAEFHSAGDGKLGGIVTPNDGQCHLDSTGLYSESLNQDYPSISQMQHKIAAEKVNIIFAVTKEQIDNYQRLSKFIEGSVAGELANDSSNIVDLVRNNYDKISGTVEMKTVAEEDVYVTFKTKCNGEEVQDKAKCENVGIGKSVDFEVTVQLTTCPKDKSQWRKTLEIYPVGLTEKLTIDLELLCECDCEAPDLGEANSPKCNATGTYECGACTCNAGRYGKNCECDGSDLTSEDYDAVCRMANNTDAEVCQGRGQCLCGRCECYPIILGQPMTYSGKYCQCSDYGCNRHEGLLCGGPERGTCKCGTCECKPGFQGKQCDCPISDEACRTADDVVCNGKGHCKCGSCVCDIDEYYRGPTCEDCPTCPAKCEKNKACVQCKAFQSGDLSKEYCDANCTHVYVVDRMEEKPDVNKLCKFRDDDDCDFYFTYEYEGDRVDAQRTKECPTPINILAIILGVIGGIIALGLAFLLIWKLFVTIHDRREFAKFEKERQNAKWDMGENPIYKQATSTFKNPTYATGKS